MAIGAYQARHTAEDISISGTDRHRERWNGIERDSEAEDMVDSDDLKFCMRGRRATFEEGRTCDLALHERATGYIDVSA